MYFKLLRLSFLTEGGIFLSEDLHSLRHNWCLSCYMCGVSFVRRAFISSMKNRKDDLAWRIFIRSFIVGKCDRRYMCSLKILLDEPHIHCKHSSWKYSSALIWEAVNQLITNLYSNRAKLFPSLCTTHLDGFQL